MNLARATRQNLTDFFRFLARAPVANFWEADGIACWRTPLAHPWFNGLLLRRPPRVGDEELLARIVAPFAAPHNIPFTLWIEWHIPRSPWQPVLDALGFAHDNGAPGMALPLDALPAELALPPGFTICTVTDLTALRVWTDTFLNGYELPAAWADGLYDLFVGLGLEYPMANYLGYLEEEPVTTSGLFYGAGVAGVQFVATLPSARRRGLGGLMTLRPLYDARRRGVEAAILQSSEMGYSVYKSIGFTHVVNVDNEYRPPLPHLPRAQFDVPAICTQNTRPSPKRLTQDSHGQACWS